MERNWYYKINERNEFLGFEYLFSDECIGRMELRGPDLSRDGAKFAAINYYRSIIEIANMELEKVKLS